MQTEIDKKLAQNLVLDELFDLTLYKKMLNFAGLNEKEILNKLIPIETKHLAAWQSFFNTQSAELGLGRKIKLFVLLSLARLSGSAGIHLILQAIEIHGIKKYLAAWERYKDDSLGAEIKNILQDEFKHDDEIVSSAKRTKIYPERVRDIFLGFNDGLVEILGAVSGFFAAFSNNISWGRNNGSPRSQPNQICYDRWDFLLYWLSCPDSARNIWGDKPFLFHNRRRDNYNRRFIHSRLSLGDGCRKKNCDKYNNNRYRRGRNVQPGFFRQVFL